VRELGSSECCCEYSCMYTLFRCVKYDTRGIMLLLACRKPFVTLFLLSSSGERGRIGAYR
jgi:hypothetical protein